MKRRRLIVFSGLLTLLVITIIVFGHNLKVQAAEMRNVTIKNFQVSVIYDESSLAAPIPNSDYTVTYADENGKSIKAAEGITNSKGAIVDLTVTVPSDVSMIKFNYTLGNANRGYILRSTGRNYQFTYLKAIPANNTINYSGNSKFGASGNNTSFETNYVAARINNYYSEAVNQVIVATSMANAQFNNIPVFQNQPINVYYERGFYLNKGSAYYRNGHDNNGTPDIVLGDRTNISQFTNHYLMHNIMHEWTHWNLSRTVGLLGGTYDTHYTYNQNFFTSYKEGLALFAGEMFAYDYDLSSTDNQVQTDSNNGVNRLFGKSTNMTVQCVLYDLLDVTSNAENEDFYITQHHLTLNKFTDKQLDEINFGVIYTEFIQSKALSLDEFLQYVQRKYVISDSDKSDFSTILTINGLSATGEFTLDENGNALLNE